MNVKVERRFVESSMEARPEGGSLRSALPARGCRPNLRCPHCDGRDLRKVSFAYEQGLSHTVTKTRFWGFWSDDLAIGNAATESVHESKLSVRLRPPVKWSYWRVIARAALLSLALLIAYIHGVMWSSAPASSVGVVGYLALAPMVVLVCLFLVWRHNSGSYPVQLDRWNCSYVCRRCGAVSEHG